MTIGKYYDMEDEVYDQRHTKPTEKSQIPVPRSPVPGSNDNSWLKKVTDDARASLIEKLTPLEYAARTGRKVTIPLDNTDAVELLRRFNAHYFAWTGKCLKEVR